MFYTEPGMAGAEIIGTVEHIEGGQHRNHQCLGVTLPHPKTRKTRKARKNTKGFFVTVWTRCEHVVNTFRTQPSTCCGDMWRLWAHFVPHAWRSRRVSSFLQVVFSWNLDRNALELAAQLSLREVFQETWDKLRFCRTILGYGLGHLGHGHGMSVIGIQSAFFGCLRSLGAVRWPAVKLILQLLGEAFPTRTFSLGPPKTCKHTRYRKKSYRYTRKHCVGNSLPMIT